MARATPNSRPFRAVAPHSNQSLLGAVSVAGKRNFEARDKGAEMAVGVHLAGRRDQAPARKPAGSGLFAKSLEISANVGGRGIAERLRDPACRRSSDQASRSLAARLQGGAIRGRVCAFLATRAEHPNTQRAAKRRESVRMFGWRALIPYASASSASDLCGEADQTSLVPLLR